MMRAKPTDASSVGAGTSPRTAARLAAVQALYQILVTAASAEDVVAEFKTYRQSGEAESCALGGADVALFCDIVRGAVARKSEIDSHLVQVLAEDWPLDRLETLLRAVLWAGAYELLARPDIPLEVVINEYMNAAHAFFADKEPAFVNGVLDRLAHEVRAGGTEAAEGGARAR
jgi:N utilization substance protein B